MRLSELASLFNTSCAQDAGWSGVSIDSRRIAPGQVFVALQGERFDGHQFIQDAVKNGALAVICSKAVAEVSTPQFVVQDTIQALATLAAHHR
ncbi:MAG TPA: UDP-N-acetylmuramoyl-tripeptide--D-alanyl-D-alanine ligase, partial [Legionella sp.]|nr:UDP-N-acetylmuramoyl-tripeptide--D-alanyl-D-alanine ligase [Legionella sp.]